MIVLLTDFGPTEYVGVMKGVIGGIDPAASIIDLCHDITPQNLVEAAWVLKTNFKYFPQNSTFCCVVDPGVGSARNALAVQTDKYYFVAPDNGVLWETLQLQNILAIKKLPIPPDASGTFHGRDVFAPAVARINLGQFDQLDEPIDHIKKLELIQHDRTGLVVRIDSFGNIITNLPPGDQQKYSVESDQQKFTLNFYSTYDTAGENELFLITGSCDTLEISRKNKNANSQLQTFPGKNISIS